MTALIILFGLLLLLAGVVIIINPEIIFGYLRNNLDRPTLHALAVVMRLIIGALLIINSDLSKYPATIEVLGWLSIAAALILGLMGRNNFLVVMSWALKHSRRFGRAGGAIAAAFGGFLIYAFV